MILIYVKRLKIHDNRIIGLDGQRLPSDTETSDIPEETSVMVSFHVAVYPRVNI